MHSTVTSKGQITIPKSIRDALDIHPNDRMSFIRKGDRVILVPVKTIGAFRGAVRARGLSFDQERAMAKAAVTKRHRGKPA